jgi:hypothetical protein
MSATVRGKLHRSTMMGNDLWTKTYEKFILSVQYYIILIKAANLSE